VDFRSVDDAMTSQTGSERRCDGGGGGGLRSRPPIVTVVTRLLVCVIVAATAATYEYTDDDDWQGQASACSDALLKSPSSLNTFLKSALTF